MIQFTAHNIRLDDGTYTKPDEGLSIDAHPWFLAAKRVLDATFPADKSQLRIADLGCLEGGYTVEFARLGFQSVGIDVRESNIDVCRYVQSKVNLPNLQFVRDDVWNAATMAYSTPSFAAVCSITWTSRANSSTCCPPSPGAS